MSINIGFVDIETTGLKYEEGHKIIELALAVFQFECGEFYRTSKTITARFNPGRSIDAKAQEVHGISMADLRDKPPFKSQAKTFAKVMRSLNYGVAHNAMFDFPFLAHEFTQAGVEVPSFEVIDTMQLRECTAMGKVPSLKEFCWSMGVEYDPEKAHAADYDVDVMAEAFIEAHRRGRISL